MSIIKIAALAAFVASSAASVAFAQDAVSPEDCQALLSKGDKNGDGNLAAAEAEPFVEALTSKNEKPKDAGLMTSEEFMGFCAKGHFANVQVQ